MESQAAARALEETVQIRASMGENKKQDSINVSDLGAALPSITSGLAGSLKSSLFPFNLLILLRFGAFDDACRTERRGQSWPRQRAEGADFGGLL